MSSNNSNTQSPTDALNNPGFRFTSAVLLLAVFLPYSLIFFLPQHSIEPLFEEDGVIEWIGAVCWFAACVLFLLAHRAASPSISGMHKIWYASLIVLTFVAGAEEISWGQRIFGFDTPTSIAESNWQGEMNLHNLRILDIRETPDGSVRKSGLWQWLTFHKLGALIWGGYLVLLPLTYRFVPPVTRLCNYWRIPVAPPSIAIIATLGYAAFALVNYIDRQRPVNPMQINELINEYKETLISFMFLLSAVFRLMTERSSRQQPEFEKHPPTED